MSTKNVTATQGQYNQGSMNTFNQLNPTFESNMQQFMQNPLQSSFFNTQQQMAQKQNAASFGNINQTMMQNNAAGGFQGNTSAYMQSNLLRNSRAMSGANSNSFNNLLLGANQLRMGATQQAGAYKPLQTGQTETKTQSGLGSWLPQLAGAALGAAGSAFTGGLSGGIPGMPGGGYSAGDTGVASGAFGNGGVGTPGGVPFGFGPFNPPPSQTSQYGSGGV